MSNEMYPFGFNFLRLGAFDLILPGFVCDLGGARWSLLTLVDLERDEPNIVSLPDEHRRQPYELSLVQLSS